MSYDEFPREFQQIRQMIEAEDFHAAEQLLKEIVRQRPDFTQAQSDLERVQGKAGSISNYEFRVKAFLDDGDIEQARRVLAEALQKFRVAPKIAALNKLFVQKAGPSAAAPAISTTAPSGGGGPFTLDESLDTVIGAPPADVVEMLKKIGVSMPAGGATGGGGGGNRASNDGGGGTGKLPSASGPDPFRRRTPEPTPPQPQQRKLVELPPQPPQQPTPQQQAVLREHQRLTGRTPGHPPAPETRMVGRSDGPASPPATGRMPTAPLDPRASSQSGPLPPRPPDPRRTTTSAHFPTSGPPPGGGGDGHTQRRTNPNAGPDQVKTTLTVNLPGDLKDWLVQQAAREGLSPSALMRRLARDYKRHREMKDGRSG